MKQKEVKEILSKLNPAIESIVDKETKTIISVLLNLVETLVGECAGLAEEVQRLRDENNQLKGEQGKPKIRKQKNDDDDDQQSSNHSSEKERKNAEKQKKQKSKKKKRKIKIDREVVCSVDKSTLPEDAQFKGYETSVIQDIVIKTDNIKFKKEVYYSPSLKKTFSGDLPPGYHGQFAPNLKALILCLYNKSGVTEPGIKELLNTIGIDISLATISRMQTDNHDVFHQEKEDIINAGLKSTSYQHIDDTSGRVNGKNHYVHILSNPYYTAYFTLPKKSRLTILRILSRGTLNFCFDEESYGLMENMGLAKKHLESIKQKKGSCTISEQEIQELLHELFPNPEKHHKNRRIILEASGINAYKKSNDAIGQLIVDDAPQFKLITESLGLCWVHEGRHYKKLTPIVAKHKKLTDKFITRFWKYYGCLHQYKKHPTVNRLNTMSNIFDGLFSTKTGYDALDEQITKTLAKKEELLLVLKFPHIPLHNNSAELGARFQARKRDINLQTINQKGTEAKDTFATLVQTANKLAVNIYDYFYDRLSKNYQMTSLANLIEASCQTALSPP